MDSNVVSELIRKVRNPAVVSWVASSPLEDLHFSAVAEAELRYGAAILPVGRRRQTLLTNIEEMLWEAFGDRVLPFDRAAAREYADIAAVRRSVGRPVAPVDCQVAAIARSRGMTVVTRNVRDFEDIGVDIFDPWTVN
ncbi:MAG: type II toxin-antitoxin system VapC family toxin [Gammaproteobacteria bacterium]|nr:type II toxin-antitoxin system VapC family toxin [Gammaproteobacteria bacterium]